MYVCVFLGLQQNQKCKSLKKWRWRSSSATAATTAAATVVATAAATVLSFTLRSDTSLLLLFLTLCFYYLLIDASSVNLKNKTVNYLKKLKQMLNDILLN